MANRLSAVLVAMYLAAVWVATRAPAADDAEACFTPLLVRATLNGPVVQDIDHTQVPALADRPECGYLSLQNHGHDVEFRRLRLKELKP